MPECQPAKNKDVNKLNTAMHTQLEQKRPSSEYKRPGQQSHGYMREQAIIDYGGSSRSGKGGKGGGGGGQGGDDTGRRGTLTGGGGGGRGGG